jgi:hypothetical protein
LKSALRWRPPTIPASEKSAVLPEAGFSIVAPILGAIVSDGETIVLLELSICKDNAESGPMSPELDETFNASNVRLP